MQTDHIRDELLDRLMKGGLKRCKTLCSKIERKNIVKNNEKNYSKENITIRVSARIVYEMLLI